MNRDFVRIVCGVLGLVGVASGQLKVPEKGWELIEKGDGKTEGQRFLGAWENSDKTIIVGIGWSPKIPDFGILSGQGVREVNVGIDFADWPMTAELMEGDYFGVRIQFPTERFLEGQNVEHYWVYGQKGGVILRMVSKKKAKFSLSDWMAEGLAVERTKERLTEVHDVVTRIRGEHIRPKIEIDPTEPYEETQKRLKRVEMTIAEGGIFLFEGKEVDEDELEKLLKAVAQKFEREKEVPVIVIVLDLVVAKGVEFRFVEQAVQIGKKAGIPEASFTSWTDLEWLKGK